MESNNSNTSNTNPFLAFGNSNVQQQPSTSLFANNSINSIPAPQLNASSNINFATNPFQNQYQQYPPMQQVWGSPSSSYSQGYANPFPNYANIPQQQPAFTAPKPQPYNSLFGSQNLPGYRLESESFADD
jgi:hypothetical protein